MPSTGQYSSGVYVNQVNTKFIGQRLVIGLFIKKIINVCFSKKDFISSLREFFLFDSDESVGQTPFPVFSTLWSDGARKVLVLYGQIATSARNECYTIRVLKIITGFVWHTMLLCKSIATI